MMANKKNSSLLIYIHKKEILSAVIHKNQRFLGPLAKLKAPIKKEMLQQLSTKIKKRFLGPLAKLKAPIKKEMLQQLLQSS